VALIPNLLKQERTMAEGSRPPGPRQVRRRGVFLDERPLALARLFSLHPAGRITVAHLEPLRACLVAGRLELDPLRFAAEDAVDAEPLMPPEAQFEDVHAHGAQLHEILCSAQDELDLLVHLLRAEVPLVS
jgi:hypothetical protein